MTQTPPLLSSDTRADPEALDLTTPDTEPAGRTSRGIQSVEVGGQLLLALAHTGRPMALKDLAQAAGMTPAKAHPYLVSFGKLGLIEQDGATGRYGLGPLALQLGLISLQQVDPVRLASAELPALARQIGHTVAIAVWGSHGPTIIRLEEGPAAVHVNMRHGTVVSVRGTASGRLFAALLPRDKVEAVLAYGGPEEVEPDLLDDAAFEAELARIRQTGLSCTVGGTVPGVTALAVPVFDGFGALALALITIGPSATLDGTEGDAPAISALRTCAQALSRRLGARL